MISESLILIAVFLQLPFISVVHHPVPTFWGWGWGERPEHSCSTNVLIGQSLKETSGGDKM